MGCKVSKANIDNLAHQPQGEDIWSTIADGANTISQELLFKWIDYQREEARKIALKDKDHTHLEGSVRVYEISATFLDAKKYSIDVQVQDKSHKGLKPTVEVVANPIWREEFNFPVGGKGVEIEFRVHVDGDFNPLPVAVGDWNLSSNPTAKTGVVDLKLPFLAEVSDTVGKLAFKYDFVEKVTPPPTDHRGFIYASYLPVLDPDVDLPLLAKPDKAFIKQDDMMQDTMKAIAIDWMLRGAVNTRKTLPQPLTDRVDDGEGDEWFTHRRLNGSCPGFITARPQDSEDQGWDFQIEWDFRRSIDRATDIKSGITFAEYITARFALSEDGTKIVPYSIEYILPGEQRKVVKNDGTVAWKRAKEMYRSFEVNTRFTYAHVGVHFNVEQYAMALYRNLSENHPIWDLLTPHFKNVITNNRKVVRPKPDGVVTTADVYTFDGQIKLLQDRFAKFSFKNTPQRVLPKTVQDNNFENTQEVMWNMISIYVEEYFNQHPDLSVDPEIQAMSKDLQEHAINKTPDSMTINDVADLKQMCIYVIFQAIFFHAWVHWKGYDDFVPVLHYDKSNPQAPPEKEADKLADQSNMIQTFVTFMSPTLKQWPILDPQLGGNQRLRELLLQNASKIDPAIQIGTLIMAPNT